MSCLRCNKNSENDCLGPALAQYFWDFMDESAKHSTSGVRDYELQAGRQMFSDFPRQRDLRRVKVIGNNCSMQLLVWIADVVCLLIGSHWAVPELFQNPIRFGRRELLFEREKLPQVIDIGHFHME